MKPNIKNLRLPRIPYRPASAADPIKNYILLLLVLLLLSAFVMSSCTESDGLHSMKSSSCQDTGVGNVVGSSALLVMLH